MKLCHFMPKGEGAHIHLVFKQFYVLCVPCFLLTVIFNCLRLTVISQAPMNSESTNLSEFLFFLWAFYGLNSWRGQLPIKLTFKCHSAPFFLVLSRVFLYHSALHLKNLRMHSNFLSRLSLCFSFSFSCLPRIPILIFCWCFFGVENNSFMQMRGCLKLSKEHVGQK